MSINRKSNTTDQLKSFLGAFFICLTAGLTVGTPQSSYAVFDPVGDDTDIFLSNPANEASRPNVLIFLDNTANWNTAFNDEKAALISVFNSLDDSFNVGLMMYVETGGGNDNVDGGYLRFAIRQMTDANKTALANDVLVLDRLADASNNTGNSQAMYEAYLYFAGKASRSSFGKVKTDFDGNAISTAFNAGLGDYALPTSPTSSSLFNSPINDQCANNFIIYIGNNAGSGRDNENASSLAEMEPILADLLGLPVGTTPPTINISPDDAVEGNWMDEFAEYMANNDVNDLVDGVQNVNTYVVDVDPISNDQSALMESVATKGNGTRFAVTSGNAGAAIKAALEEIFDEIQSVNSVFASTTLPVSVNVRGTNLNQVYVGVFRPDAERKARWFGNLKAYKLGFDTELFLEDANGNHAESGTSGFINITSPSFWTVDEFPGFWRYRSDEENNSIDSDFPDGNLVEKGGVAQQLRIKYATDHSARNLYTCTGSCSNGDLLSDTPFDTSNTDITDASLGLGSVGVSTLSAAVEQSVISLTDTKSVDSLNTALGIADINIDSFDVGTVISKTITNVTTKVTLPIGTAVTPVAGTGGLSNDAVIEINTLSHPTTGSGKNIATAIVNAGHGLTNGDTITISGASQSEFNGTFTITDVNATTFTYDGGNPLRQLGVASATGAIYPGATTTVLVTMPGHPYVNGDVIEIAGVVPVVYNSTGYTVTNAGPLTFEITTATILPSITGDTLATAIKTSTTAVATATGHGFADNTYVKIAGMTNSAYDGTFQTTLIDANTFSYVIPTAEDDSDSATAEQDDDTTVTVTTDVAHGYTALVTDVSITGATPSGFNVSGVIQATPSTTTFTILTATAQPPTASTGTVALSSDVSTTAMVTIPGHGFATSGTFPVIIEGVANFPAAYITGCMPATATYIDADTFSYTVCVGTPRPATGTITARLGTPVSDKVTAFANATAHGLSDGDFVIITGADQTEYNQTSVAITKIDDDNFKFLLEAPDSFVTLSRTLVDATGTIIATTASGTATVRAVAHGFVNNEVINISGATDGDFNDDWNIIFVDANTFTIDLITNATGPNIGPKLDATGPIIAAGSSGVFGTQRVDIINWTRGEDNFEDENLDTFFTDARASIHSDVLHSRPAVINYNRFGANFPDGPDGISGTSDDGTNDYDVYIYYGANDGVFRAIRGGFGLSDASEPDAGEEAWGFIPREFFIDLKRLRNNEPIISSDNPKDYFADGSIGVYVNDENNDGILDPVSSDSDDKVWLFITMHRGGNMIYALDVSIPTAPRFMWSRSGDDTGLGWGELGQTWSVPSVRTIAANSGKPVLIFGAGYDPKVDDLDPDKVTAINTSNGSVTTTASATPVERTKGRGIFVVDAETGDIVVQIGPSSLDPGISAPYINEDGMIYSIPSDIAILPDRSGSIDNRMYVGDTGGNMWRVDMADADVTKWEVTKIANIADTTVVSGLIPGARKFLFPPDVVYGDGAFNGGSDFDAILIGSGDRENPFDTVIQNRFYMFKDEGIAPLAIISPAVVAVPATQNLVEGSLFDATNNCIQNTNVSCASVVNNTDLTGDGIIDNNDGLAAINSASGWYITLLPGEKVVGNAVTLNTVTFFNTNEPTTASSASCESDLGTARQYKVVYGNATVFEDQNSPPNQAHDDRFVEAAGGGFLPSPVPVVVEIDGVIHEGVISGTQVTQPPGTSLGARLRKFWYKEIED